MVKNICEEIGEDLKPKTLEFLQGQVIPRFGGNSEDGQDPKVLQLEIKQNDEVFIQGYSHVSTIQKLDIADIRPKLRRFLRNSAETLSSTKLITKNIDYELTKKKYYE